MKKIRYIPYGYTMRNGRTVISTEEAEVIRDIFKAYLNGASLKAIAEELTGRQIPYTQKTTTWDKARIARIIDNAKYVGTEEYDPIIDEDMYEAAVSLKTARQAIGYKELIPYFAGEEPLAEAVGRIKQESRRYAKRQLTWFRRNERISWIYPDECQDMEKIVAKAVEKVKVL